jgi:hypothetical protein
VFNKVEVAQVDDRPDECDQRPQEYGYPVARIEVLRGCVHLFRSHGRFHFFSRAALFIRNRITAVSTDNHFNPSVFNIGHVVTGFHDGVFLSVRRDVNEYSFDPSIHQ